MKGSETNAFHGFLRNNKSYPVLAAVAAGLYPLLFYYSRNFTLIDSWAHFGFFIGVFLLLPMLVFWVIDFFLIKFPSKWSKFILPFLNIFFFLFYLKMILYPGIQKKIILGILIVAALVAYFLYKHFKKWILLQFILAGLGLFSLIPVLIDNITYSGEWRKQPDNIENATFQIKPNVYYIQPDGYVNFSELKKGYYNFPNTDFEVYLNDNNFKNYPNFRSNYDATLASNSATFMMKHHLYASSASSNEVARARNIIISDNTVLNTFKKNGYKTFFFTEHPYLMMNRPKLGYDFSNFSYSEVPFLGSGMETKKEILPDFKEVLNENGSQPKFFFIELFNPKHIDGFSGGADLAAKKREIYLENLQQANAALRDLTGLILEKDPNALIMIMADHGGYVGLERVQQGNEIQEDSDKVFSIFSSMLSIHWPNNAAPEYDAEMKTAVNVFRVLFTYLSGNQSYLENLQPNLSY